MCKPQKYSSISCSYSLTNIFSPPNDCFCRNEKIRTYNFNRHMLTDHRLGESRVVPNIVSYLSGDYGFSILTEFKESLEKLDIGDKFEEIIRPFSSS